jgi:dephospho-CoA kinase
MIKKIVVTGNIGSGKSTICSMLVKQYDMPFFNADTAIQEIYQDSSEFYNALYKINPNFCDGKNVLKQNIIDHLARNPDFLNVLEDILYPLLAEKRKDFIEKMTKQPHHKTMILFEVPLLFEKNLASDYNFIILCYAPYKIRLERALKRPTMTQEKFDFMNNRQLPYEELVDKVNLAIDTTASIEQSQKILEKAINVLTIY